MCVCVAGGWGWRGVEGQLPWRSREEPCSRGMDVQRPWGSRQSVYIKDRKEVSVLEHWGKEARVKRHTGLLIAWVPGILSGLGMWVPMAAMNPAATAKGISRVESK